MTPAEKKLDSIAKQLQVAMALALQAKHAGKGARQESPWGVNFKDRPSKAGLPKKLDEDEDEHEAKLSDQELAAIAAMGGPSLVSSNTRTIVGSGNDVLGSGDVELARAHLARGGK